MYARMVLLKFLDHEVDLLLGQSREFQTQQKVTALSTAGLLDFTCYNECKLAIAICVDNFVKSRLFTALCKDMDANHETLLFNTADECWSKGNLLARVYELRKEVELFLEAQEN